MNVLLLSRYDRLGASSRLRTLQFLPSLAQAGIRCTVSPFLDGAQLQARYQQGRHGAVSIGRSYARRLRALLQRHCFDLVWIEKEALPWLPAWVERALLRGVPYVLDYDDALFHAYDQHRSRGVRLLLGQRVDRLMSSARLVIAGNAYLAQRAQSAGCPRVEIVPTVVDLNRYPLAVKPPSPAGTLRIVWIGSPTTARYLEDLREPLATLAQRIPFRLRIIGRGAPSLPGVDVEPVAWSESTEVADLQACDVGIMPLPDTPWERGKCGYKLIQYMACGLPVVAAPVGVNTELVRDGENGFLARDSAAWATALETLLRDGDQRQRMGAAGRASVEARYNLACVAPHLQNLLRAAAAD